jgi:hypothetical protein
LIDGPRLLISAFINSDSFQRLAACATCFLNLLFLCEYRVRKLLATVRCQFRLHDQYFSIAVQQVLDLHHLELLHQELRYEQVVCICLRRSVVLLHLRPARFCPIGGHERLFMRVIPSLRIRVGCRIIDSSSQLLTVVFGLFNFLFYPVSNIDLSFLKNKNSCPIFSG